VFHANLICQRWKMQNSEFGSKISISIGVIGAELLSAAQNPAGSNELKTAVIDLIDRGLPQTLQDLQLIDQAKP
jgi:hypothetical protein